MEFESQDKINSVLKSLFRYNQMTAKSAPPVLLEMEKVLLMDRVKVLSPDEFYQVVMSWPDFYEKQLVINEIEDEACARDLKQFYLSLN